MVIYSNMDVFVEVINVCVSSLGAGQISSSMSALAPQSSAKRAGQRQPLEPKHQVKTNQNDSNILVIDISRAALSLSTT